jgi:histidine triad (HIT) family protein
MEDCIFCKIVKGEIPSAKVYEDDAVFAFADINPLTDGHTLVIPKKHVENIWDMEEQDLLNVQRAAKKLAEAMKSALDLDGLAFLQLNGKAVNQIVMHYHLHLLPRVKGAPEISLTKWELVQGDMDRIKSLADKIAAAVPSR